MSTGGQALPSGARVILRGLCGSTIHGTSVAGTDDRDEMGICIEPREYVIGLRHFETHVHRTQPDGVRSGPGDLDLTIHSLRKYARLAAAGNPTIITLLFLPERFIVAADYLGRQLVQRREMLFCRRAGQAFLGYMTAQRERLEGLRGGQHGWRQELVDRYGFDTKYAGHMIRLGLQGIEFLTSGHITLPMREAERAYVLDVRQGRVAKDAVLGVGRDLEAQLKELVRTSPLPEQPDHAAIDGFLVDAYETAWRYAPTPPVQTLQETRS